VRGGGVKLAIIGGGGFRVPLVYRALARSADSLVDQVWLYDTSSARLAVISDVLRQLGGALPVHCTTVLDEALEGSDFVFSAMRVGGLAGRVADERAAFGLGLIGQETTGPGGIAYGLRTIPVAMAMARRVLAVAPGAYVINFTNPAGMITEAMQSLLSDHVIGICDTPSGLGSRLARQCGVPAGEVRLDYAGLNHLGWLRGAHYRDRDLVGEVLAADDVVLGQLEEAQLMGGDWLRTLGMIPNEYLYYYYCQREARRAKAQTRGEYLQAQQDAFYRSAAADPARALQTWQRALSEREATYMADARPAGTPQPESGGYEYVALGLISAIAADQPSTMILNVRNDDALPGLPASAVVEVPCHVDGSGARPLPVTAPAGAELGLMQQVKEVEQLTIRAATERDPRLAYQALALHPLVDSVAVAGELLATYRRNEPLLFS
jgi:6-phospho-beta-glucosidase